MCKAEGAAVSTNGATTGSSNSSKRRRAAAVCDGGRTSADVANLNSFESEQWIPSVMKGYGWKARGDRKPTDKRVPFNRPTAKQVYEALPFVRRYFVYWMKHTFDKEKLFINTFQPLKHKPFYGVPCGTIGSGAMGRDFRGGFCKFSLRPGLVEHKVDVVPANQFILTVRKDNECIYQKVLCGANVATNGALSSWEFDFPKKNIYYRGLFPRSWTCYRVPELNLMVVLRQISPVIPNDYEDSSMPVTCFVAEVHNNSNEEYEVSLTLAFRNGTGNRKWERESDCTGYQFTDGDVHGVALYHSISQMPCTYGLASTSNDTGRVSVCQGFDPSKSGACIWDSLKETGCLTKTGTKQSKSRELAVAISNKMIVPSGSADQCDFVLSWDMPCVKFGSSGRNYKRRYTRFMGTNDATSLLCCRALKRRERWEALIDKWQNPILQHTDLPDWYKSAIFNELYFITDGGSLWFEFDDVWSTHETQLSSYTKNLMRKNGRFGYLESWEYRMVNTYDVHFYASFALAQLWPEIEMTLQAEFTDQIAHSVHTQTKFHMEGDIAGLKTKGRVPHDLGNPADDPWLATNAYVMHDTGKWKDLNLKYVLTSWRDLVSLHGGREFLEHTWPAVKMLINDALSYWDKDKDGMIENFGKADQTYDAWQMEGVSAYCGSLWLAALRVSVEMARQMDDILEMQKLQNVLEKAKKVFVTKLWTGEYFRFCEISRSKDTIMADQMCGIWFLQSVSPVFAEELLPSEMVSSALSTIYAKNVCGFADGKMGAVNGMRPDGKVDREYIQADEVWTGVTYAVAAFLIQQGKVKEAFHTASGCYETCFERSGLQYQTPEALYETKFYRAIGYMRPLSIWSMQWALERHRGLNTKDESLGLSSAVSELPSPVPNDGHPSDPFIVTSYMKEEIWSLQYQDAASLESTQSSSGSDDSRVRCSTLPPQDPVA